MNQELGLRILSGILEWNDDQARREFDWLRLMARLKYDGYRDFQAGMRFIESLATWLQQFERAERQVAYRFLRTTLLYVGPAEMQRLVEQFYPRFVRDRLVRTVAAQQGIPHYRVLASPPATAAIERLRRQTLFMGLSDGARIDIVRHSNVGILTNEQLVVATQVDKDKWQDLRDSLRGDLKDKTARFAIVYLIDDFMGTGTSLLRYDEVKTKWKGKLIKFKDSLANALETLGEGGLLEPGWQLCVVAARLAPWATKDRSPALHSRPDRPNETSGAGGVWRRFGCDSPSQPVLSRSSVGSNSGHNRPGRAA